MVMILDRVGKIETRHNIYHMGFAGATDSLEYRAYVQIPFNPRATLEALSNANTPEEDRQAFIAMNTIPGARYVNGLLTNADQILPPKKGLQDIQADHTYTEPIGEGSLCFYQLGSLGFSWRTMVYDIFRPGRK